MHILSKDLTLNYSCITTVPLCADLNRLFSVASDAEIYVLGSYKKMADKRKLQGEIDRCTKKVAEGLETFEDLWKKVTTATNVNIKEKHEADLKKEIKKLQRFRDSIKSWLTNPEVKDKSLLIEHKRLIETKMEMFKVVERETKTKAYSKEGLTCQSKVDPKEKEKEDVNSWISQTIETLKIQIDQFECEIENSTGRRKKVDKGKQGQLDHFKEMLDKHKSHIEKLESIMRLLDNDALQLGQIQSIREDVDYYSQSNQEDNFQENGFIYDDLNLDEISASLVTTTNDNVSGANDDDHSSTVTFDTNSSSCSSPTIQPPSHQHHHHSYHHPHHNYHHYSFPSKEESAKERVDVTSYQANSCSSGNSGKSSYNSSNHLLNKPLPTRPLNETTSLPLSTTSTTANYAQVASIGVSSNNIAKTHSNSSNLSSKANSSNPKHSTTITSTTTTMPSPTSSPRLKHNKHLNFQQPPLQQQQQQQKPKSLIEQSALAMAGSMLVSQQATSAHNSYSNSMNNIDDIPLTSTVKKAYKALLDTPLTSDQIANTSSTTTANHISVATTDYKTTSSSNDAIGASGASSITRPKSALLVVTTSSTSSHGKSLTPTPLFTSAGTLDGNWSKASSVYESLLPSLDTAAYTAVSTDSSTTSTRLSNNSNSMTFSSIVSSNCNPLSEPFLSSSSSSYYFSNPSSSTYDSTLLQLTSTSIISSTTSLSTYHLSHLLASSSNNTTPSEPKTLRISTILGVTPLGPTLLTKQHSQQLQLLEAASLHLPQSIDSSKISRAIHSLPMPYKNPPHYTPPTPFSMSKLDFYLRLNPETLFYAFYYLEGSLAQLLAAKALKQLSWRFHKKLLIWFQRHEDPKVITEEYEQGSYLYFDFERWTLSTIESFIFEYRYLEDRDLL